MQLQLLNLRISPVKLQCHFLRKFTTDMPYTNFLTCTSLKPHIFLTETAFNVIFFLLVLGRDNYIVEKCLHSHFKKIFLVWYHYCMTEAALWNSVVTMSRGHVPPVPGTPEYSCSSWFDPEHWWSKSRSCSRTTESANYAIKTPIGLCMQTVLMETCHTLKLH